MPGDALPVWVRRWACRDFSRGKTRLQIGHLMLLGDWAPSMMRVLMASALGRPRFESQLFRSGLSHGLLPPLQHGLLNSTLHAFSPQFHGYNVLSVMGGLPENDIPEKAPFWRRFGVENWESSRHFSDMSAHYKSMSLARREWLSRQNKSKTSRAFLRALIGWPFCISCSVNTVIFA